MKRTVVKIGGALLAEPLDALFEGLAELQQQSEVILVHGGGPQTTAMANRLGHSPTIVEGRRVTTDLDLDIVKWMIRGQLNVELVARASLSGIRALGMSGADAGLIQVSRRPIWSIEGKSVDFGHVGDFQRADPTALLALLQSGIMPIVCPPGMDQNGHLYNINADTVALEVASAVQADELILVTETGAVLDDEKRPIRRMYSADAQKGVSAGWISGGMKVKTDIGFSALKRGIANVWILGPESLASKARGTQLLEASHA
ncbi:MAG: acetylglutamate kinase [Bacteroidetes bacterium]|nr:acetylglutamate kinase [Bacteroidota bacterium]